MHPYRTITCGALQAAHEGQTHKLSGWVHRIRDHGGVLFLDLRDTTGLTQVVVHEGTDAFTALREVHPEWCITVEGQVALRAPHLANKTITTGAVELTAAQIDVLGRSKALPLPVYGDQEYPEETRLKYRYLDLRRPAMQEKMILRSKVIASMRQAMWAKGFHEHQTPIITVPSPEGARDFLVPSRLHPGKFYALPQAPQMFKQLLMVAGFDRYFQVAPCFRDETPRADRSPTDFYQLDLEMSFTTQEEIFALVEDVLGGVFSTYGKGASVDTEWPSIPYREAKGIYGTDKPDLRCPIRMRVVSDYFRGSGFSVFAQILEKAGTQIRAIPAPGGGSRKFCERMDAFARAEGLSGMGYIFWRGDAEAPEAAGPIAKAIGLAATEALRVEMCLGAGDAVMFCAGLPEHFEPVAAKARVEIGRALGLFEEDRFAFAWITDLPMLERDKATGTIGFEHNPLSMPKGGKDALEGDPLEITGVQYDLACNGYELLSGPIRNHDPETMLKVFAIAGYGEDEVKRRFGALYEALQHGAPPHGGCAAGIDRIVMLLAGEEAIREVMLFPMNQQAQDVMMEGPKEAESAQLRELHIRTVIPGSS
ncbi:aspartate--tRNA ligase [Loktanella sp. DJP18]|uniref:aspartate--tRNA ligase n=1 Tax=Loktanella sp. DJP18 TaxID=3409788 RepID=UPI003BB5EFF5